MKAKRDMAMKIIFKPSIYDPPSAFKFRAVKFENMNITIVNIAILVIYLLVLFINFEVTMVAKRYATNV
jgi:hypothetical protein